MSDAGPTITSITPTQGTTFATPALVATPHTTQQTVYEHPKFDAPPSYDVATRFSPEQQYGPQNLIAASPPQQSTDRDLDPPTYSLIDNQDHRSPTLLSPPQFDSITWDTPLADGPNQSPAQDTFQPDGLAQDSPQYDGLTQDMQQPDGPTHAPQLTEDTV